MRILSTLVLGSMLLFGNEVERIESIVNDVTELRNNYEACQSELVRLKASKPTAGDDQRLKQLEREITAQRDLYEREIERMQKELEASEKQEELLKSSLETARRQNSSYQQQIETMKSQRGAQAVTTQTKVEKVTLKCEPQPCIDSNPFPKLLMKEEYREMKANGMIADTAETVTAETPLTIESTTVTPKSSESSFFKPRPFRVTVDTDIYDAPEGKVIDHWEAKTSFTSGEKRAGWIRITGYFIDRVWHPSKEKMMWVEEKNTVMR